MATAIPTIPDTDTTDVRSRTGAWHAVCVTFFVASMFVSKTNQAKPAVYSLSDSRIVQLSFTQVLTSRLRGAFVHMQVWSVTSHSEVLIPATRHLSCDMVSPEKERKWCSRCFVEWLTAHDGSSAASSCIPARAIPVKSTVTSATILVNFIMGRVEFGYFKPKKKKINERLWLKQIGDRHTRAAETMSQERINCFLSTDAGSEDAMCQCWRAKWS